MQKRMQHQGGWAVTFVVVGVVLLVGLVGGVYFLKTRTSDQVATNENTSSEIERAPEGDNPDNKSESSKPDQDTSKSDPSDSNSQQSSSEPQQDAPVMPETGPTDAFLKIIAVSSLTVASVAYLRSR